MDAHKEQPLNSSLWGQHSYNGCCGQLEDLFSWSKHTTAIKLIYDILHGNGISKIFSVYCSNIMEISSKKVSTYNDNFKHALFLYLLWLSKAKHSIKKEENFLWNKEMSANLQFNIKLSI